MGIGKNARTFLLLALTASIASCATHGAASPLPRPAPGIEYSAEKYIESGGGVLEMKVWYTAQKERTEIIALGSRRIIILRKDKNFIWALDPALNLFQKKERNVKVEEHGKELRYYKAGEDMIEGRKTEKFRVTKKEPGGETEVGFIWLTEEGISIKSESFTIKEGKKMPVIIKLKNLKIGPLDKDLFEIPDDYSEYVPEGHTHPGGR